MTDLYRSIAHESEVRRWCADRLDAWQVPHTTGLVTTSLGDTHLTVVGEGADTCAYLPGTNFNAATSTGVLAALSTHCRVVCADLPGQPGLSAAGRPREETQAYARWVSEVVQESRRLGGGGRLVLMGHSRGAAVALSAEPDSVDALVLLSPAGLAPVHLTPVLLMRSVAWLLRPTPGRTARLVELMAGDDPGNALDQVVEWMTLVARTTRTTGAPGPLPADVLARWRGRRVRILVGARDTFFPPRRLEGPTRRYLGKRPEIVEDAGHLLVDQRPEAAATALAAVLAERDAG